MKMRTLATLALTLASAATIPSIASAHERDDFRFRGEVRVHEAYPVRERVIVRDRDDCREFDTTVSLREVPSDVLNTVDCERHGRPIESVQYVRRDGKLFYRFRIDDHTRHGQDADFNIRVAPGGRLLSVADAG